MPHGFPQVTIELEFNDAGAWRPVIAVTEVTDRNNIAGWYIDTDNGSLNAFKASRGDDAGQFRDAG